MFKWCAWWISLEPVSGWNGVEWESSEVLCPAIFTLIIWEKCLPLFRKMGEEYSLRNILTRKDCCTQNYMAITLAHQKEGNSSHYKCLCHYCHSKGKQEQKCHQQHHLKRHQQEHGFENRYWECCRCCRQCKPCKRVGRMKYFTKETCYESQAPLLIDLIGRL